MARLSWNTFKGKHASSIGFAAQVSARLPKAAAFDKNGLKLPTPLGLFKEWATANLTGDWAVASQSGWFMICVESSAAAQTIEKRFGVIGASKATALCANTFQLRYQDRSYPELARSLGYNP